MSKFAKPAFTGIKRVSTYEVSEGRTLTITLTREERGWWVREDKSWDADLSCSTGPFDMRTALDVEEEWAAHARLTWR
jgi:hypothetical protein